MKTKTVGCIELGGTSAAVAIANSIGTFVWKKQGIPTNDAAPKVVIKRIADALKGAPYKFSVCGIASFGPLNISRGEIAGTPKPGWKDFPLVAELQRNIPKVTFILDTDVNAPAYSEYLALCEEDPGPHCVSYLTVGTGVGLGLVSEGKTYHGLLHPEVGHIPLKKYPGDEFEGSCPFHGDCLEGLISSGAIAKRLGILPADLPSVPKDDPVWDKFSFYLAGTAMTAALAYAIDVFYVGGGIVNGAGNEFMIEKANAHLTKMLAGYVQQPRIALPHYLGDAGLVGAAAVALHPEAFGKVV